MRCVPLALALAFGASGCVAHSTMTSTRTSRSGGGAASTRATGPAGGGGSGGGAGADSLDAAAGVLEFLLNLPSALSAAELDASLERAEEDAEDDGRPAGFETDEDGDVPVALSAGFARTRLWTSLRTGFESPSFTDIDWVSEPKIGGNGAEGSLLLFGEDNDYSPLFGELGLHVGFFERAYVANSAQRGALFVRERVESKGLWGAGALRVYFSRPAFVSLLAGLVYYRLKTGIETNAPSFVYDGVSGDRVFGSFGLGAGLRTPWDFPLQATGEARVFMTAGQDPVLESTMAQFLANLVWRF